MEEAPAAVEGEPAGEPAGDDDTEEQAHAASIIQSRERGRKARNLQRKSTFKGATNVEPESEEVAAEEGKVTEVAEESKEEGASSEVVEDEGESKEVLKAKLKELEEEKEKWQAAVLQLMEEIRELKADKDKAQQATE